VLPLALCVPGLLRHRMYTYRWLSLLVWLYVTEGVVRATSERPVAALAVGRDGAVPGCCSRQRAVHPLRLRGAQAAGRRLRHERPTAAELLALRAAVGAAPRADRRRPVGLGTGLAPRWRGRRWPWCGRAAPPRWRPWCGLRRARRAIVPQGGNTGLVGGGVPDASGTQVLLSLQRLNRVRAIDAANLTLTAEAGCVLQAVQEAAACARACCSR
jgi:hypothetical protein